MNEITASVIDVVLDALIDTAKMIPFLYVAFYLMEYFEHKAGTKFAEFLGKAGKSTFAGPAIGSLLGCVPQCGFSAAASNLYSGEMITLGTLIAVFLSTSDEALPIMLSDPSSVGLIWKLLLAKVIIAFAAGVIIDAVCRIMKLKRREKPFDDICTDCGCGNHGIWYSALRHTIEITIFILIVNLVLGGLFEFVGEERVMNAVTGLGSAQPLIAALVGLIPNCAASVIITELYVKGAISFGSAIAGLCTGAGAGLLVLFRENKSLKENLTVLGLLYVIGSVSGILINLF